MRVKAFSLFFFETEVGEVNEKNFEDNIIVKKFGWICDNLSKFENHLMNKQTLMIPQFGKIENLI